MEIFAGSLNKIARELELLFRGVFIAFHVELIAKGKSAELFDKDLKYD